MNDFTPHAANLFGEANHHRHDGRLGEKFMIAPFTVLNAREGWWQNRKEAWLSLGIRSEVGRGEDLLNMNNLNGGPAGANFYVCKRALEAELNREMSTAEAREIFAERERQAAVIPIEDAARGAAGTSIFDPVLCELAYRWFCPEGGVVLDPFAGGSVRGVVASKLGRLYVGIDLRAEQVAANRAQGAEICDLQTPIWHEGDSLNIKSFIEADSADMVFSCPPYGDLERYSDDPRDLSAMEAPAFRAAYAEIIAASCSRLKMDRFACFVIGDARDKRGLYYGLPWLTVSAFEQAGLRLYNEAVLVTSVGNLPIRTARLFESGRKMGKAHQNVLIFVKGDPRRAADCCKGPSYGN